MKQGWKVRWTARRAFLALAAAAAVLGTLAAAAAADLRIAVVDMQRALNECEAGKKAKDQVKAKFERSQESLKRQREDLDRMKEDYDRKALEYGLSSRHVPFGSLGIDFKEVQTAFASPERMTGAFLRESRRLAAQGAEVILAACATVNAIIRRENIQEVDGALVMDCNAVLLKLTEAMAELAGCAGLRTSQRLLYQRPDRGAVNEWMRIYNFRARPELRP